MGWQLWNEECAGARQRHISHSPWRAGAVRGGWHFRGGSRSKAGLLNVRDRTGGFQIRSSVLEQPLSLTRVWESSLSPELATGLRCGQGSDRLLMTLSGYSFGTFPDLISHCNELRGRAAECLFEGDRVSAVAFIAAFQRNMGDWQSLEQFLDRFHKAHLLSPLSKVHACTFEKSSM